MPGGIFSLLIENALDAVLIIDSQGRIGYTNSALASLCGYTTQELKGQSLNQLLPDSVAHHHDQYLQAYLCADRPSTVLGKIREMQLRHRCGEIIPVEMKAIDIGRVEGTRYFAGFMADLRPRKLLETQKNGLLAQLQQLALTDALTDLPNRRAFESQAKRLFALAKRENFDLSVAVADLDRFKAINDTYGHPGGDYVLHAIAQTLKENMREGDYIGRTGGEEFGVVFSTANLDESMQIAQRLRNAVEQAEMRVGEEVIRVTISIGITQARPAETVDGAMARADKALYLAKRNGRNRVEAISA